MRRFAHSVNLLSRRPVGVAPWSSLLRRQRLVQVGDWITLA
jgi:hypothetical protein